MCFSCCASPKEIEPLIQPAQTVKKGPSQTDSRVQQTAQKTFSSNKKEPAVLMNPQKISRRGRPGHSSKASVQSSVQSSAQSSVVRKN